MCSNAYNIIIDMHFPNDQVPVLLTKYRHITVIYLTLENLRHTKWFYHSTEFNLYLDHLVTVELVVIAAAY